MNALATLEKDYLKTAQPSADNAHNAVEGTVKVSVASSVDYAHSIDWNVEGTWDFGHEISGGIGGSTGVSLGELSVTYSRPFGFECVVDDSEELP